MWTVSYQQSESSNEIKLNAKSFKFNRDDKEYTICLENAVLIENSTENKTITFKIAEQNVISDANNNIDLENIDIDNLLNEVDKKEEDENDKSTKEKFNGLNKIQQKELGNATKYGDVEFIRNFIAKHNLYNHVNELCIDSKGSNKYNLLDYAAKNGEYGIIRLLLNFGASITDKSIKLARENAHIHVVLLLEGHRMGAVTNTKINEIVDSINHQNGTIKNIVSSLTNNDIQSLYAATINCIKLKIAFSDDILNMIWLYFINKNMSSFTDNLYNIIIETCKQIINGNNHRDWYWLKNFMMKSMIWFRNKDDIDDHKENTNIEWLYDDLINVSSNIFTQKTELIRDIDKNLSDLIKCTEKIEGEKLLKYGEQPRQDEMIYGVKSDYTEHELNHSVIPSEAFNANFHNTIVCYLGKLLITAHQTNDEFQNDMKELYKINDKTNESELINDIHFKSGPLKQIDRCTIKSTTDYLNEKSPQSAHLLDIIRCTISVNNVKSLIMALNIFINKINDHENNQTCIIDIIRVKNGFKDFDIKNPNYSDIKFNILIKATTCKHSIVGEIQFLLNKMSEFKENVHKIYKIIRLKEFINECKKILPSTLDIESQLFTASPLLDTIRFCDIMTTHNLNKKEMLKKVKRPRYKTVVSILYAICRSLRSKSKHNEAKYCLEFWSKYMNDNNDLFVDALLDDNSNFTVDCPLRYTLGDLQTFEWIYYKYPQIQKLFNNHDNNIKQIIKASLLFYQDINVFHVICNILKIKSDKEKIKYIDIEWMPKMKKYAKENAEYVEKLLASKIETDQ